MPFLGHGPTFAEDGDNIVCWEPLGHPGMKDSKTFSLSPGQKGRVLQLAVVPSKANSLATATRWEINCIWAFGAV